jgi:hypothetical protein
MEQVDLGLAQSVWIGFQRFPASPSQVALRAVMAMHLRRSALTQLPPETAACSSHPPRELATTAIQQCSAWARKTDPRPSCLLVITHRPLQHRQPPVPAQPTSVHRPRSRSSILSTRPPAQATLAISARHHLVLLDCRQVGNLARTCGDTIRRRALSQPPACVAVLRRHCMHIAAQAT